jgi:hypothetical protein
MLSGGKYYIMNKLLSCECNDKMPAKKIMAGIKLSLVISCLLAFGCSKKEVEVQMETPQAVKDVIKDTEANNPGCTCHPYISQYIWRNKNVYVSASNDQLNIGYICDWIPIYYNSNGEEFKMKTGYTYDKFSKDSRLIKTIWACN